MKTYTGKRTIEINTHDGSKGTGVRGRCDVMVNDKPLQPMWDMSNNESVYEWNYRGVAPTHLALSLLANVFEKSDIPDELVMAFRDDIVINLSFENWSMTDSDIFDYIDKIIDISVSQKTED